MICFIYRSTRRDGCYLYLAERDRFDQLPEALLKLTGRLEFAMELELTPERKLAREDARQVVANLEAHGYHLQSPPPDHLPDPIRYR